jgi:hypothetical protein
MRAQRIGFIHQQGFSSGSDDGRYAALMFQPRAVTVLVLLATLLQSPWLFLTLSAVLGWNALVPGYNLFDGIYNRMIADRRGLRRIDPAPAPRRFAQGLAATFAIVVAAAILSGAWTTAFVLEGLFVIATLALVFLRFCVGSFLYHLLAGRRTHAR